ncbi:MAG: hypothetical protein JEZ09_00225 [Salinivirgaceae bacterium]|nr:hypothetical protein [Salinivirgaceae bacterium]
MGYIERYQDLLKKQNINYFSTGKVLFREYNKIIVPLGPILQDKDQYSNFSVNDLKGLKGFLIWWSYTSEKESEWYGVIKDSYFDISDYKSSNVRNQIKKGLKNNQIKKLDIDYLLENGYSTYKSALKRFTSVDKIICEETFVRNISAFKGFNDIIDIWGIFQDEAFVGYSIIYTYDKIEANISEVRINPAYQKMYPSYALFHMLQEYYLKEKGFDYVSDGYRSVSHETKIQDLLIDKFGFRKLYLSLNLHIVKPLKWIFEMLFYVRGVFVIKKIEPVIRLMSHAKNNE